MIMRMLHVLTLLSLGLALPTPGYTEETTFLSDAGFSHLTLKFEEEEVEIQHIPLLDDPTMRELELIQLIQFRGN